MSKGNTKAECTKFEGALFRELSSSLGLPKDEGHGWAWTFAVLGGEIKVTLSTDSKREGRGYRSRTVFARFIGRDDCNPFGMSGKNNLHLPPGLDHASAFNTALNHVRDMTQPGTPARRALDDARMIAA